MIVVWLPPNTMGLSAVCDCGISRSYSLIILSALLVSIFVQRPLGFYFCYIPCIIKFIVMLSSGRVGSFLN